MQEGGNQHKQCRLNWFKIHGRESRSDSTKKFPEDHLNQVYRFLNGKELVTHVRPL